jgi:hypothetical protein
MKEKKDEAIREVDKRRTLAREESGASPEVVVN